MNSPTDRTGATKPTADEADNARNIRQMDRVVCPHCMATGHYITYHPTGLPRKGKDPIYGCARCKGVFTPDASFLREPNGRVIDSTGLPIIEAGQDVFVPGDEIKAEEEESLEDLRKKGDALIKNPPPPNSEPDPDLPKEEEDEKHGLGKVNKDFVDPLIGATAVEIAKISPYPPSIMDHPDVQKATLEAGKKMVRGEVTLPKAGIPEGYVPDHASVSFVPEDLKFPNKPPNLQSPIDTATGPSPPPDLPPTPLVPPTLDDGKLDPIGGRRRVSDPNWQEELHITKRTCRVAFSLNYHTFEEQLEVGPGVNLEDHRWETAITNFVKQVRTRAKASTRRL